MKKIIYFITVSLIGLSAKAQVPPSALSKNAAQMTIEEANRLNGKSDATINGKPYSQYKAEQDALKKQQERPTAVQLATPNLVKSTPADQPVAVPTVQKTASNVAIVDDGPRGVKKTGLDKVEQPAVQPTEAVVTKTEQPAYEKFAVPAIVTKEVTADQLKTAPAQQLVTTKSVEVNNATSTTPAALVSVPVVNVSTGAGAAVAEAPQANKLPEVSLSQAKPTVAEEIKPTAVTPAPKVPAVPMQTVKPKEKE